MCVCVCVLRVFMYIQTGTVIPYKVLILTLGILFAGLGELDF